MPPVMGLGNANPNPIPPSRVDTTTQVSFAKRKKNLQTKALMSKMKKGAL